MTVHAGVASSSMTKATQETAVGEGLAVGCLALGVTGVSSARVDVNLSFSHAWRNWPPARVFTVVKASLDRNDIRRILHGSANRRWSMVAAWECGRWHEPDLRSDWTIEEAGESLADNTGVGLDAWTELARVFVERLGPDKVSYAAAGA
jgi:hypothetical protein